MSKEITAYAKVIIIALTGIGLSTGHIAPDHADAFQKDSLSVIGDIITTLVSLYTLEHTFAQLMADLQGTTQTPTHSSLKQKLFSFLFVKKDSATQSTATTNASTVTVPAPQS